MKQDFFKALEAVFFILGLVLLLDRFERLGSEHITTTIASIAVLYLGARVL